MGYAFRKPHQEYERNLSCPMKALLIPLARSVPFLYTREVKRRRNPAEPLIFLSGVLESIGRKAPMTIPPEPSQQENTYFIDHENVAEMARLLDQDRLYTQAMGGLLPERANDFSGITHVLDVGCGPGGWAQELAFAHPELHITGIDIGDTMIAYAQAQARVQHLSNAHFQVMNVQEGLGFPDASFDLVNARLLGFFSPSFWPHLMTDYVRLARPAGLIRLAETEMSFSNSPALEQEHSWFFRSLWRMGSSFSSNGERLCISAMLAPLLRQAGCINVQVQATALDWSYGTSAHAAMYKNMQVGFKLLEPFYLAAEVATQEEIDRTYTQMLAEMHSPSFAGLHLLVSASGQKPA
jgi:ubiquinone/menaquinone biosynthesis C-methylase UbiE